MKKIALLCFSFFALVAVSYAQAPQRMSYQAVIRNSGGNLLTTTSVGTRVSILQGSATGTSVYTETHTATTNTNGLLTLSLGSGTVVSGNFANIDWAAGPYFIKTETDPAGGINYTIAGTTQMMSVPYALYAKEAENGFSGDYDDLTNAPTNLSDFTNDAGYITTEVDGSTSNEIQALSISGSSLSLSNGGGTVTLPTLTEVDGSVTNEIQALSLSGSTLSLSNGGGSVTLPDASATNEIQSLTISGSTISLSNGGGSVSVPAEVDGSVTNEIQGLSISGNSLSLSNGGGTVSLPTLTEVDGSVTNEIQTIGITGTTVTLSDGGGSISLPAEVDGSVTNEIQALSLSGNTLSLDNGGGSVTLPSLTEVDGSVTNEIQALSITGSTVSLSNGGGSISLPAEVDGSVTNEIQALSISGNTLSLNNGGGSVSLPTLTEVDGSVTNEIQTISLSSGTVSLSNSGGSFALPDASATNEIQTLSISGSTLSLSNGGGSVAVPAEVDGSVTNEIQTLSISGSTITLSNSGGSVTVPATVETDPQVSSATNNVVPKWNGTTLTDGIIQDNGTNVGIGINPTFKLDVSGTFRSSGQATVQGGLLTSGTASTLFGSNAAILANAGNVAGGGIIISDDGGFIDVNDGVVTFVGTTGLKIAGTTTAATNAFLQINGLGGGGDRKVMTDNTGKLFAQTLTCPTSTFATESYSLNLTTKLVCIYVEAFDAIQFTKSNDCRSFYNGASICTYAQVQTACNAGVITTIATNKWLADRLADDSGIVTNGTACNNFDGTATTTSQVSGVYCCLEFYK